MTILRKYVALSDAFTEWLGNLPVYIVLLTVFIGFLNVVLRYSGQLIGQKLTNNVVIELQWYLYTLIFLLGFSYILKNQINVRVDFWYAEQSPKLKAAIDLIGHLIALLPFCLLALYITLDPIKTSWGQLPNGSYCFENESTTAVDKILYFVDIFDLSNRYCGEISPDPNGLNRAPIQSMIYVAFLTLLLQAIAEAIKLIGVLTGREEELGLKRSDHEAPIRIE
ncbi:MAG: TRAP transporter small permease subunit [Anaerolineales bacterium]|nr:TRAP transporter small permease subunit [Anaerolineales bacterium]MCB8937199.1 TRAP transporter small permease subunit [Ardenticatenaceae bacterium]